MHANGISSSANQGVRNATNGYAAAFVEVYRLYYRRVYAYIYARCSDEETAKDLTAETFIKAYTKGHHVRDERAYAGWLFAIARNVTAGYHRSSKRHAHRVDRLKDSLRVSSELSDPDDVSIRREQIATIQRHLSALGEREQHLLSLKFDAELSTAEIAEATGLSEVNIRVSIFRALTKLRNRIAAEAARPRVAAQPAAARAEPRASAIPEMNLSLASEGPP